MQQFVQFYPKYFCNHLQSKLLDNTASLVINSIILYFVVRHLFSPFTCSIMVPHGSGYRPYGCPWGSPVSSHLLKTHQNMDRLYSKLPCGHVPGTGFGSTMTAVTEDEWMMNLFHEVFLRSDRRCMWVRYDTPGHIWHDDLMPDVGSYYISAVLLTLHHSIHKGD